MSWHWQADSRVAVPVVSTPRQIALKLSAHESPGGINT